MIAGSKARKGKRPADSRAFPGKWVAGWLPSRRRRLALFLLAAGRFLGRLFRFFLSARFLSSFFRGGFFGRLGFFHCGLFGRLAGSFFAGRGSACGGPLGFARSAPGSRGLLIRIVVRAQLVDFGDG